MKCIDTAYRTLVPVREGSAGSLTAGSHILLLGSCFTDNIGAKLTESGVPAIVNPSGVLYNPRSIAKVLRAAMQGGLPEDSIFSYEGRTRCWLFPTGFSSPEAETAVRLFTDTLWALREALLKADALIITFGTAWIYDHKASALSAYSDTVGNCHKVPAGEFARRRLGVDEIAADWCSLLREMDEFRASAGHPLKLVFTVSPIRHFKDGAHENTISKATLHLAIEAIRQACPTADYFNAWELLMDDLRDYRFYAEDMLHPSSAAIDYIWQHFLLTYFSDADRIRLAAQARANRAACHRPLLK